MIDRILDIVSDHTQSVPRAKTLIELAELENKIAQEIYTLIKYDKKQLLLKYENFLDNSRNLKDKEQTINFFMVL